MLKINFYLLIAVSISTVSTTMAQDEMPITAKPGQCFTKSFYPPKYKKPLKPPLPKELN